MRAFLLNKTGARTNLEIKNIEEPHPHPQQVLIRHTAIGINYFDVLFRNGAFKLGQMPSILGIEACGIIEKVGKDVVDYKVGERVAYATGPLGAYAEKRAIDQHFLITPPKNLSDEQVAGSLLKGMMAHTLLFRVYTAAKMKRILIHAAAGGVGHFLCQWAKHLGLEVIGTVGSDAKVQIAKSFGCDHVINYSNKDFLSEVDEITKGGGVGIVYDGVGKDTIKKSIECLWPTGMCVTYGESSGESPPINLDSLMANSVYVTRPLLASYKSRRPELVLSSSEVFSLISKGILKPNITTYNFDQIPQAHADLEGRKSTGSLVIKL
ncbi:MAG: NADPH2:quinone reductase [Rickettsiales bacterium]|jgi:NADPH2:quinone reductase